MVGTSLKSLCLFFFFFSSPGVGVTVPAAAAAQPVQQSPAAQAALQPSHMGTMQPQPTPQHLLLKQQHAFLSPQSHQQVGVQPQRK